MSRRADLALPLFVARIFLINDVDTALPSDDLIVSRSLLDGSMNLHVFLRCRRHPSTVRVQQLFRKQTAID